MADIALYEGDFEEEYYQIMGIKVLQIGFYL